MPISQARLFSVLDAADDILAKYQELTRAIKRARLMPDTDAAIAYVWDTMEQIAPEITTIQTLAKESGHFTQSRRHKNNRDAATRRASRGQSHPGDEAYLGRKAANLPPPRFATPTPGFAETMGLKDEPISPPARRHPVPVAEPIAPPIPVFKIPPDIYARIAPDVDATIAANAPGSAPRGPISPPVPKPAPADIINLSAPDGEEWEFPADEDDDGTLAPGG